jgi:tRNA U34 5-carboxymethylaminomethyl modifying GTPase MnmE/TrmE
MTSQQIFEKWRKFLQKELQFRWEEAERNSNSKFRVLIVGLVNSGKSSLCNALCDSLDDSLFKVGVVRETTAIQEHDDGEWLYIDTPGLDCNSNDTALTMRMIASADAIFFVHSLKTSELDADEHAILSAMAEDGNEKERLFEKTFWILTKLDDCGKDDVQLLKEKITTQIFEYFGRGPERVHCVGSTRYRRGKREGKNLLVERSRITVLKDALRQHVHASRNRLATERREQRTRCAEEVLAKVRSIHAKLESKIVKHDECASRMEQRLVERIQQIGQNLKIEIRKYEEI